jgi:hypothetical protein
MATKRGLKITLDAALEANVSTIAKVESRSLSNAIGVLLREAIWKRQKRQAQEQREHATS